MMHGQKNFKLWNLGYYEQNYVLSTTPSYTARDNHNHRLMHTTYLDSTTLPATQVAAISYKQHDACEKSTRATPNHQ